MKNTNVLKNLYIAHRGLHDIKRGVPENSLSAFAAAVAAGLPIELDLHLLRDGRIAVFHDDNLRRMTGCDRNIADCTYEDIRTLTLCDTGEHIPLMEEVLSLVNGRVFLDIELKTDIPSGQLEPALCRLLDAYKGGFAVKSFDPFTVNWFRRHRPHYIRGQLSGGFGDEEGMSAFTKFIYRHMLLNVFARPDFIAYEWEVLTRKNAARYKKKNRPLLIWTLRSYAELKDAQSLGDSFICEGFPFWNVRDDCAGDDAVL